MRIFMFFYTVLMIVVSAFTLGLVPRALRDLGQERRILREKLPGAEFEQMVEAGYRMNAVLLLVEILYYYFLLRYAGPEWQFFLGGSVFGLIHICYLVVSRLEKRRLTTGKTRTGTARLMIWLTAVFTAVETVFLLWVAYLLTQPAPA